VSRAHPCRRIPNPKPAAGCLVLAGAVLGALGLFGDSVGGERPYVFRAELERPLVIAQIPARKGDSQLGKPLAEGMLRGPYGDGARLLLVLPDGTTRILSRGFASACDPDVSFDAKRLLFAGKRTASDPWDIYEMVLDELSVRQITAELGDCRSPSYQSTLYTIISPEP